MKKKNIAAFLAIFGFGIHRFYLEDRKNGVAYLILSFFVIGFLLSFIDFFVFLFMEQERFDRKYNSDNSERRDFTRRQGRARRTANNRRDSRNVASPPVRTRPSTVTRASSANSRAQVHIKAGKEYYSGFDYFEAIAQWTKAIALEPRNAAIHYNLACAYSLTEQAEKSFYHLSEAVKFGFNNFDKLTNQDALAFLRIQTEFDDFAANGYMLDSAKQPTIEKVAEATSPEFMTKDILEQLKELGELRERGILTEEEFVAQKKKLI